MCGGACFPPPPGTNNPAHTPGPSVIVYVVASLLFILSPLAVLFSMSDKQINTKPQPACIKYESKTAMQYMPGVMGIGHPGVGSWRMVTRKHCVEYETK